MEIMHGQLTGLEQVNYEIEQTFNVISYLSLLKFHLIQRTEK